MKKTSKKIGPPLKRILPEIFLMTSHLNSHGTTDIKPEMLSGVQTGHGTPHDKYNIRGIARAYKQKRRHFHAKTTGAKLYIFIGVGQGTCLLTKHTRHWAYSRYFFPASCLLCFAVFFCFYDYFISCKPSYINSNQAAARGIFSLGISGHSVSKLMSLSSRRGGLNIHKISQGHFLQGKKQANK